MAEKARTCPRCRGRMVLRLDEYECERCGYFMARDAGDEPPEPAPREGPPAIHTASQPPPSSLQGMPAVDQANQRLAAEKLVFLVLFALVQTAGGLALLLPRHNAPPPSFSIAQVVLTVLIAVGLASLVLYIDWYPFKKVAMVVLVLGAVFCGYMAYAQHANSPPYVPAVDALDAVLMVWLAVILFRDVNLNE